jgi:hypothetical protein
MIHPVTVVRILGENLCKSSKLETSMTPVLSNKSTQKPCGPVASPLLSSPLNALDLSSPSPNPASATNSNHADPHDLSSPTHQPSHIPSTSSSPSRYRFDPCPLQPVHLLGWSSSPTTSIYSHYTLLSLPYPTDWPRCFGHQCCCPRGRSCRGVLLAGRSGLFRCCYR